GEFVQVETPGDIYEEPNSRYVANFIGDVNLIPGTVASIADGKVELDWGGGKARFKAKAPADISTGQIVWLSLRPEKLSITLDPPTNGNNALEGKVVDIGYLGSISHYHVE